MRRYVIVGAMTAGLLSIAPAAALVSMPPAAALVSMPPGATVAQVNPTTGHKAGPVNTCGPANPVTPGNAVNAKGSPFNPNGQAGSVYAGNPGTKSLQHSNSTAPVSQYDNACINLSSH